MWNLPLKGVSQCVIWWFYRLSTSPLTISPLLDVNLLSGSLFWGDKKEKGPPNRRLLVWAREVMEFSQAIFHGLFRKLQVSTPVVLCFIQCSCYTRQSQNDNLSVIGLYHSIRHSFSPLHWYQPLEFFILTRQREDKRQDIYYHNITSTIFWHAVSKKTLVEACQINSITNQILYYNK